MAFATDEEIRVAHDVLLKGKQAFNEARVNIIKEDNSCYVQACPGSGKTTALLAKLIILANKMPLPEGKGVCVLTHTNVAIDEIKAKLGPKSDVLFRYPNFFGTIQTFLHKYVAATALHYFYDSQINIVDNDVARAVMLKKYCQLPYDNALKKLVYAHTSGKEHILSEEQINAWGGEDVLVAEKVIKRKGKRVVKYNFQLSHYEFANIPRSIQKDIRKKSKEIIENEGKEIVLNFKVDWENNRILSDNGPIGMATESGAEFKRLKEEMFREGNLSFEDAYDLAFRYIHEKNLDYSSFSDQRFKYLFIDEVQDCDKRQVQLIKKLFADDKVIVQRFGDYCQAIFEGDGSDGEEIEELRNGNALYIHDSIRFGKNIAKPLQTLCMEDNHLLEGNEDIPSARPVIIVYEDPIRVLPKYEELLRETRIPELNNLSVLEIANKEKDADPLHRINVKACGWVGKRGVNDQKRFIESYFPAFEKKNSKVRTDGESFDEFIFINPKGRPKEWATAIIQGVIKFLDLCDVKNGNRRHNQNSFLAFLTEKGDGKKGEFLSKVMNWAVKATVCDNEEKRRALKDEIYLYLTTALLPLTEKEVTEDAKTFFYAAVGDAQRNPAAVQGNVYHGNGIDIEVSTVHAVKGETHVSTLYLETYYKRHHESDRLADQFKGIAYAGTNADTISNLRVAYVGMSRARYLLCVTMQKERFEHIDCHELREIWGVVEV